ncbi:MAG: hypothetical protein AB1733_11035 [Thermodesulfobacteriota bacterium]
MKLPRIRHRISMAGLIAVLAITMAGGGFCACVTHHPDLAIEGICCRTGVHGPCDCEEEEASRCTCPCTISSPAVPTSAGDIVSLQTRTASQACLSPGDVTVVTLQRTISNVPPSVNLPASPEKLRSVIILI